MGVTSGPNNLDPRIASDDTSQKLNQLIFSSLMTLDEHLRPVPQLAERIENPDPLTWVITVRRGVKFHDGHELTSADVAYTFRSLLEPGFISPLKGAYRMVRSIDVRDRYTVVFNLNEPFVTFPGNLVVPPIAPDGAGPRSAIIRSAPARTGSSRTRLTIGWSWRRSTITTAAARRTTASSSASCPTTSCAASSSAKARWTW